MAAKTKGKGTRAKFTPDDSAAVRDEYRAIMAAGGPSGIGEGGKGPSALRDARIIVRFRELEAAGRVRLRTEPDNDYEWNECDPEEFEKFGADGAWGSIAEVRADPNSDPDARSSWEEVDSCWGHVGYRNVLDPRENCYIVDHMRSCIRAVEDGDAQRDYADTSAGD